MMENKCAKCLHNESCAMWKELLKPILAAEMLSSIMKNDCKSFTVKMEVNTLDKKALCDVGDSVYIPSQRGFIEIATITKVSKVYGDESLQFQAECRNGRKLYFSEGEIGFLVFLTKEDAHLYIIERAAAHNESFMDRCVADKARPADIDYYVSYWHSHETGKSLQDFLGMTDREFELLGKSEDGIIDKIIAHRKCVKEAERRENAAKPRLEAYDIGIFPNCVNLAESYGIICVRCNKCGRFNKK